MKLVRFGERGSERPGLIDGAGRIRDLAGVIGDITPEAIAAGLRDRLARLDPETLPAIDGNPRLGAPMRRTGHFIAIGLNYEDHARESNMPIPKEPIVFSKAPSSLSGPYDDIILPPGSVKSDWEVELAFVMGRRASHVGEAEALDCVFGYAVCNDVSERALQLESTGQWIKGKSAETFGPLGPFLVTADEVGDPQNLSMWLDVNGERMQTGSTATMIFSVAQLVSYLSRWMVLEPGDVVTTGTPPGVGMGKSPQRFLKDGDVMTLGIEKLGEQRQRVVARAGA